MTDKKVKLNAAAEQPSIPDPDYTPSVSDSTFGDWGFKLPVGILKDGVLHRDIAFNRWTMKEERAIGKMRKRRKRLSMSDLVTYVMAFMLAKIGPYDFAAYSMDQRQIIVNQMWLPDVIYAYICLRIQALGEEVKFDVECAMCGNQWKFPADLSLGDVSVVEKPEDLIHRHKLRDGIEPPNGGDLVYDLVLQPALWQVMGAATPGKGKDAEDVKMLIMAASIRQIGDGSIPPVASVLDGLTKYDLEHLTRVIDDLTPGADLTLECLCPVCSHENKQGLNWSYDFFFTASSL